MDPSGASFIDESPSLAELVDLKEIQRLFYYFSVVTGLDVALFDFSGREILANRKGNTVCESAGNCRKCRKHISYGGMMSQDLGEPYICSCGCGLIMCFSPVMFEERLIGIIACGPVLLWEADEVAVSEFTEKTRDMNIHVEAEDLLRSATSCSCVNMTSTSQLLFITVNSITREHSVFLKQRAQITRQQQRIADLLIDRKNSGKAAAQRKGSYPVETEKELIEVVKNGNREQAKRILNILLGEIFSFADGNMDTIRARLFELVAFFSRAAVESGAPVEAVNGTVEGSFRMFGKDTGFEELCFLAGEAMEAFIGALSFEGGRQKRSRHLARAVEYIGEHYADDITLHSVAGAVYISEFYLSHLFRKEMDTTFSDYVSRVRIDRAKTILKKALDIRIQELSEIVGFNDANYFAKSFKKLTGQSPREYQASFIRSEGFDTQEPGGRGDQPGGQPSGRPPRTWQWI
ncbi:MAG: PocR ligand-binding domain-containing protein [Treponema sp.]|jgi:two-component system response regulator YesN|nr:PocR ligand-binding domain-containing protein [Treponema sp.]